MFPATKTISFRESVSEIEKSTYLTHSLYYYPAKFIPQIVRFCLDNYTKPGGAVLDPFGGSGTIGVEAAISGHPAYLLDINPLLEYFYPLKIPSFSTEEWQNCCNEARIISQKIFFNQPKMPTIINNDLAYWYQKDLYNYFCKFWNNFHKIKTTQTPIVSNILILMLFKLSKLYSYAEHSMPKLFTSKRKKQWINDKMSMPRLMPDYAIPDEIQAMGITYINEIEKSVNDLLHLGKKIEPVKFYGGVDSAEFNFSSLVNIDCIITSPPYLQAQEYMRTFKLEMMWSGIPSKTIRSYISREIPFRKAPERLIGDYVNKKRSEIDRKDLLCLYDSYFWFTIQSLENSVNSLADGGHLCILVGNPKMQGVKVEIWKVIYEHFIDSMKFKLVELYEDRIVHRKLFSGRKNQNPDGMRSEYLLVLQKT